MLPNTEKMEFDRRAFELRLLASLPLITIWYLRLQGERVVHFVPEAVWVTSLACFVHWLPTRMQSIRWVLTIILALAPLPAIWIERLFGSHVSIEVAGLTVLSTMTLASAMVCLNGRNQLLVLAASGFLMLFNASIADGQQAVYFALIWMTICLWHLVANHWERLEVCMPDKVSRGSAVRPTSALIGLVLMLGGGLAVRDRFDPPMQLGGGIMPTSGGSRWSDFAARSGVGLGGAAVAAEESASSFGAVESDIFLESTEPTLFDMFGDQLGEPLIKKENWFAQSLDSSQLKTTDADIAKSDQAGDSFSTLRRKPESSRPLGDREGPTILRWSGPTGVRLAMNRYETFDGTDWTNTTKRDRKSLTRFDVNGDYWMLRPELALQLINQPELTAVNRLSVLRLNSNRIPAPMLTGGVHIKDIVRHDMFAVHDDDSIMMPNQNQIPPLTVINLAAVSLMEDQLLELNARSRDSTTETKSPAEELSTLAKLWTSDVSSPYQKLRRLVTRLRSDFDFDRSVETKGDDAIAEFLETRRGGDHLFATTLALMAREIGLESRFVTGFYVHPGITRSAGEETDILRQDVHAWVEVKLSDDHWFAMEPTPGYRQPRYRPSFWLASSRLAANHWPHAVSATSIAICGWLSRLIWIDWILTLLGWSFRILGTRQQLRTAMWIVETRARLSGFPRPPGVPQRDWLLQLSGSDNETRNTLRIFCDNADRIAFGSIKDSRPREVRSLGHASVVRTLRLTRIRSLASQGNQ